MTFLIRKIYNNWGAASYRGCYRGQPGFQDGFEEKHPVNQMFFKYLDATDTYGLITDLELAKQIVDSYRHYIPKEQFEVLSVIHEAPQEEMDRFVGFDISSGFNVSYLYNQLDICLSTETQSTENELYAQANPLMCLLEAFFRPKLNSHSLFSSYETAKFCLDCIMAFDRPFPNLWDDPKKYTVIGLSVVYPYSLPT
jgi:hypothetical protein